MELSERVVHFIKGSTRKENGSPMGTRQRTIFGSRCVHTHNYLFLMEILCFHRRDEHLSHLQAFNLTHTHRRTLVCVCFNIIASWFTPHLYTSSSTLSRFLCSPCDFQHLLSPSLHSRFLLSHSSLQLWLFIKGNTVKDQAVEWWTMRALFMFYKWFWMKDKETVHQAVNVALGKSW